MKKTLYNLFLCLFSLSLFSQTQIGEAIPINARHVETNFNGDKIAIAEDVNGTIYVKTYTYENSIWTTNSSNDISNADIGINDSSLSMSKDGNFLVVGSSNRSFNSPDPNLMGIGIVRVYENVNNLWVQVGNDLMTGNQIDGFGDSSRGNGTDISADGSIIAIGVKNHYGNGNFGDDYGLVRVFQNSSGNWVQLGSDIVGELDSNTGSAVSLSDDGLTMAVGAAHSQNFIGNVKIYGFQNNDWVQIGNQITGESERDLLTYTMSISADGNRLAVSTPNPANFSMGYAKVFENINNNWTQIGQTIGGDGTYFRFGIRISFSSDGSILALSSDHNTTIYQVTENSINQFNVDIDSNASPMNISSDGTKLIVENSSEVLVYDITGITLSSEEYKNQIASFFPNPAKDKVNIILDPSNTLTQVKIFTVNGKEVLSSNVSSINTSTLISGIYIAKIETELGISYKKLIID